jgi:hypothetical protein
LCLLGGAVGERLRARARRLRLLDEPHDAGERDALSFAPTFSSTGRDSPVSMDSFTALSPVMTSRSAPRSVRAE